ncbi:MAG: DUF3362 domain-containing protein [Oscillospiraceae bacterium]|nr:DUF3362 domain-containing protein [Oscillospiraceae bacterium]
MPVLLSWSFLCLSSLSGSFCSGSPGTLSTAIYYTGLDPRDMSEVFVARDPEDKTMQRALLQSGNPKNHALVRRALTLAGREDLIGWNKHCLVPPEKKAYIPAEERDRRERKKAQNAAKSAEKPANIREKAPKKGEKPAPKAEKSGRYGANLPPGPLPAATSPASPPPNLPPAPPKASGSKG